MDKNTNNSYCSNKSHKNEETLQIKLNLKTNNSNNSNDIQVRNFMIGLYQNKNIQTVFVKIKKKTNEGKSLETDDYTLEEYLLRKMVLDVIHEHKNKIMNIQPGKNRIQFILDTTKIRWREIVQIDNKSGSKNTKDYIPRKLFRLLLKITIDSLKEDVDFCIKEKSSKQDDKEDSEITQNLGIREENIKSGTSNHVNKIVSNTEKTNQVNKSENEEDIFKEYKKWLEEIQNSDKYTKMRAYYVFKPKYKFCLPKKQGNLINGMTKEEWEHFIRMHVRDRVNYDPNFFKIKVKDTWKIIEVTEFYARNFLLSNY